MSTASQKSRKGRKPIPADREPQILSSDVVVPTRSAKRFYGAGIPGVQPDELQGRLIVIEGADGSGRSTPPTARGVNNRRTIVFPTDTTATLG